MNLINYVIVAENERVRSNYSALIYRRNRKPKTQEELRRIAGLDKPCEGFEMGDREFNLNRFKEKLAKNLVF